MSASKLKPQRSAVSSRKDAPIDPNEYCIEEIESALSMGEALCRSEQWWLVARVKTFQAKLAKARKRVRKAAKP